MILQAGYRQRMVEQLEGLHDCAVCSDVAHTGTAGAEGCAMSEMVEDVHSDDKICAGKPDGGGNGMDICDDKSENGDTRTPYLFCEEEMTEKYD